MQYGCHRVPGMQSNPRTIAEPVPMVENAVGDSPPSQSHLQDLLLHVSDIAVSRKETHTQKKPR